MNEPTITFPDSATSDRRHRDRPGAHDRRGPDRMYFFDGTAVPRALLLLNVVLAIVYLALIGFLFPRANPWLFGLLIVGEIYHVWQIITYIHAIWGPAKVSPFDANFREGVDIFITVCGEPADVVEETVSAAKAIQYPNARIFILNDGYVAKKKNWEEIEQLAEDLDVFCITRKKSGGAKAGNINHALAKTGSPFVVIFDADHIPHQDFLEATMGYFVDPKVAYVQSPQYYRNRHLNYVTAGAWEQQELFFGTLCPGKQRVNAVTMAGTNMVIRRTALEQVGGIYEKSVTEDFLTGAFMHDRGWKSVYVPRVLAQGLAPEDFRSYSSQQFRWARGSLEMLFKHNPLFWRGLSWSQKLQYLASASFYLFGLVVILNAIFPLVFFFTGAVPFRVSTMLLAAVFLPYIFLTVYILRRSSGYHYTYRAVSFSMGAFLIHVNALVSVLFGLKNTFVVTSKKRISGNFISLVIPHIAYIAAVFVGFVIAVLREGFNASVTSNLAWALFNVAVFVPFIIAALPAWQWLDTPEEDESKFAELRKDVSQNVIG